MSKIAKLARTALIAFILLGIAHGSIAYGQLTWSRNTDSERLGNNSWWSGWYRSDWIPSQSRWSDWADYSNWSSDSFFMDGNSVSFTTGASEGAVYIGFTRMESNSGTVRREDRHNAYTTRPQWTGNSQADYTPGTYAAGWESTYKQAVVSSMSVNGNYTFSGTNGDPNLAATEASIVGFNRDSLLSIEGGTVTFNIKTEFHGGVRFNAGTIVLGNDHVFNTYLGNYNITGIPPGTFTRRGIVDVRGGEDTLARTMTIRRGPQSMTLQNRFEVSENKTIYFDIAKHTGTDQHILTISGVDTSDFDFNRTTDVLTPQFLRGGAIWLQEGALLDRSGGTSGTGPFVFSNNKANQGGAIYATNSLSIKGNTRFTDNIATVNGTYNPDVQQVYRQGGAIYMYGMGSKGENNLNFNLISGDIAFQRNYGGVIDDTDLTSNAYLESIYLNQNVSVSVTGDRFLYFEDAIRVGAESANNSLTVDIRPTTSNQLGFIQFSGTGDTATHEFSKNLLSVEAKTGGDVNVFSGEFRVTDYAEFRSLGSNSEFTVSSVTVGANIYRGRLAGGQQLNKAGNTTGGLLESTKGFFINGGIIAPDNFKYIIPADLSGLNPTRDTGAPNSSVIGQLTLLGNLTFNNAKFLVDNKTSGDAHTDGFWDSDRLIVKKNTVTPNASGKFFLGDARSTVVITTFDTRDGEHKYLIATTESGIFNTDGILVNNDTVSQYFTNVLIAEGDNPDNAKEMTGRQGASLSIEDNAGGGKDLVLKTDKDANLVLVWQGNEAEGGNRWENFGTLGGQNNKLNWLSTRSRDNNDFDTDAKVVGLERMYFKDGDYVFFNNVGANRDFVLVMENVIGNQVVVSGMEILGNGTYTFTQLGENDNKIVGDATHRTGVVATGKLRVGENATAVFELETAFSRGIELSGNGTIQVEHNKALGVFDAAASNPLKGTVVVTPYIDNDGNVGAPAVGTIKTTSRKTIQNRFKVLNSSTLTFDITDGTELVISDIDTTGFTTASGELGGAMFFSTGSNLNRTGGGLLIFSNNSALDGKGSAIFANGGLTLGGNLWFDENVKNAVYVNGNEAVNNVLTLNTDDGDIVFSGSGADMKSIFMNRNTQISILGTENVFFDIPIGANTTDTNAANNSLTVNMDGFVQFLGSNVLNKDGANNGAVNVTKGMFRLADNATFRTAGSQGTFTVGTGATLAGQGTIAIGPGNTNNKLLVNGRIAPDSDIFTHSFGGQTGHVEIDRTKMIGTLTVDGNMTFAGATFDVDLVKGTTNNNDKIDVNGTFTATGMNIINILPDETRSSNTGSYDLIVSDATIVGTIADNFELWVKGARYEDSAREKAELTFTNNGAINNAILHLSFTYSNLGLIWDGNTNDIWNTKAENPNWTTGNVADGPQRFDNYDAATFNETGAARPNVNVDGEVVVSKMTISAGDYIFTGSNKIVGVANNASGGIEQDGSLLVTGGSGTFRMETDFFGGTEMQGGKIVLAHNKALGVFDNTTTSKTGYVNVTGSATLAVDAAGIGGTRPDAIIQNRFQVANNAVLTFDVDPTRKLTITGLDMQVGTPGNGGAILVAAGGDIAKAGKGALIFSGNKAVNGGAIAAMQNLTIFGNTSFVDNAASGVGNAIYMAGVQSAGVLELKAAHADGTKGDIAFDAGTTNPADSIHLANNTKLLVSGPGSVYIGAPVTSAGTGNSLEVAMGADGMVQFLGASTINGTKGDLVSGTMRLGGPGASMTFNAPASVFTVAAGGTLAGGGTLASTDATLTAGTFNIYGTISADSYVYKAPNILDGSGSRSTISGEKIGQINLHGNVNIYAGTVMKVNLEATDRSDLVHVAGTLEFHGGKTVIQIDSLIDSVDGYEIFTSTQNIVLYNNDKAETFVVQLMDGTTPDNVQIDVTDPNKVLLVVKTDGSFNTLIYWTGKTNANWYTSGTTLNWVNGALQEKTFNAGDYVVFDSKGASQSVVTLIGERAVTSGMEINGVDYTFNPDPTSTTAQKIVGSTSNTTYSAPTGLLKITGGAEVTMNLATEFEKGIEIETATFHAGHDEALGAYISGAGAGTVGAVKVTQELNLVAGKANLDMTNRFDVEADAVMTIATADGHSMTLDGEINLDTGAELAVTADATDTVTVNSTVSLTGNNPVNVAGTGTVVFDGSLSAIGGGNSLTKTDTGTLTIKGVNTLNAAGSTGGAVQVNAGTLQVLSGASLINDGTTSTFNLASGATLLGSGAITAGTSTLAGNVIIGDDATTPEVATLTFNGNLVFNAATINLDANDPGDNDVIVVSGGLDVGSAKNTIRLAGTLTGGTYDIVTTGTGVTATGDVNTHFNISGYNSDRGDAYVQVTGNNLQVVLSLGDSNLLYWTGETDNRWNESTQNWEDQEGNDITFQPLDYVVFDTRATKNRDVIVASDYTVSGMEVSGGVYSFSGKTITGATAVSGKNVTIPEAMRGLLNITGGTTFVTINNTMSFIKGTRISDGATVTLGSGTALGVYNGNQNYGEVVIADRGTIKVEKDLTIANRFIVETGAELNMNVTPGKTLVIGVNAGNKNGGAFAIADGGALKINGNGSTGGKLILTGNRAGNGAGIHAAGSLTVNGNVLFLDNEAGDKGGAIYSAGDSVGSVLNLNTTAGNIGFEGNFADSGMTPNAIYLAKDTELKISGTHGVYFGDGVDSGIAGGNSLRVSDTATAIFAANSVISQAGTTGGAINIDGGVVKVLKDVTLTSNGAGSLLTVAKGGTLAGSGTVVAGQGVFVRGTLSADSDTYALNRTTGEITQTVGDIGELTIDSDYVELDGATLLVNLAQGNASDHILVKGEVVFNSTTELNKVEVGNVWVSGTFDLLSAEGGFTGDEGDWEKITRSDRQKAELKIDHRNTTDVLQLVTWSVNDSLLWTNGDGTMVWDSSDKNWADSRNNAEVYLDGDQVSFTGYGQGDVTIANGGVITGGMKITRGDYTFSGGPLGGSKTGSNYAGATGMLEITGGSAWFDTRVSFDDGILISGKAYVGIGENDEAKMISSNGNFHLGKDAILVISPKKGMIEANEVVLAGTVLVNAPEDMTKTIEEVIVARNVPLDEQRLSWLFDRTYGLHSQTAEFLNDGKRMDLAYREIGMREYADINKLSWNMRQMSYLLDDVFNNKEFKELYDYLLKLDSNMDVNAVLDQMRGVEIASNSLAMSLWSPWRPVFNHLSHDQRLVTPTAYQSFYRGQLGSQGPSTRDFWAQAFHRTTEASGDGNSRSNVLSRTGIILGIDKKLDIDTTLGAVLNYTSPENSSVLGKNEADDWGMAVYAKRYFGEDVYVNAYLGFGHQENRYKRYQLIGGKFDTLRAKYDGNSLYASVEAVRPIMWKRGITVMLVSALDYQKTWSGDFVESGSELAQRVTDGEMGQLNMRLGLNSRWRIVEDFSIDTRLQYSRLVSGDDYGQVSTTFAGLATPVASRTIRGIDLGEESLNVGIGAQAYMTPRRTMYFFVDYDFDVGYKATSHQGMIGFVRQF